MLSLYFAAPKAVPYGHRAPAFRAVHLQGLAWPTGSVPQLSPARLFDRETTPFTSCYKLSISSWAPQPALHGRRAAACGRLGAGTAFDFRIRSVRCARPSSTAWLALHET